MPKMYYHFLFVVNDDGNGVLQTQLDLPVPTDDVVKNIMLRKTLWNSQRILILMYLSSCR